MKLVSIAAATIAVLTSACSMTESALVSGTSRPAGGSLPTMVGCGVTGQSQVIARQARVQSGVEVASFQNLPRGRLRGRLDPWGCGQSRSLFARADLAFRTAFVPADSSHHSARLVGRSGLRGGCAVHHPHRERRAHDRWRFPLRGGNGRRGAPHGPTARPTNLTRFGRSATRLSICSAVYPWAPIAATRFPSARTGRSSWVRSRAKRACAVRWFRSTRRAVAGELALAASDGVVMVAWGDRFGAANRLGVQWARSVWGRLRPLLVRSIGRSKAKFCRRLSPVSAGVAFSSPTPSGPSTTRASTRKQSTPSERQSEPRSPSRPTSPAQAWATVR